MYEGSSNLRRQAPRQPGRVGDIRCSQETGDDGGQSDDKEKDRYEELKHAESDSTANYRARRFTISFQRGDKHIDNRDALIFGHPPRPALSTRAKRWLG
jgi:hypothetical protein